ncbi:MAG: AAA family ATPase [Firmicutes bacterium]|nr:AAA family ATPase [Bacillota bacterium]
MYISRLKLRNWKNFNAIDVRLGLRVFLIGPNASGKSNLLDAFKFLRDVAEDGLKKAVEGARGGVSAIRCLSAKGYSNIDIEVELTESQETKWVYILSINQGKKSKGPKGPLVQREIVRCGDETLLERPTTEDEKDPLRLTQTALEQISENKLFRPVADFFKSISYQHLLPQLIRDPSGFSPRPVQNDPYGRDFLLRKCKTPEKTREARLKKIARALSIAVPQLSELTIEMDDTGTPHLIGRYEHWRARGAKQNESQFSDGTLRLLGLLWTVFEGTGPLLLEEPEISLHPELVRRLPGIFRRLSRAQKTPRQIIISTHSEEMLRDPGIAPEEVLRLEPSEEGTLVKLPDEAERKAMAAGLTAADVLMPKAAPKELHQLELEFKW